MHFQRFLGSEKFHVFNVKHSTNQMNELNKSVGIQIVTTIVTKNCETRHKNSLKQNEKELQKIR